MFVDSKPHTGSETLTTIVVKQIYENLLSRMASVGEV